MIRIITFLLATLTIICKLSAQDNADSSFVNYTLEPVIFNEKIGDVKYTIQNYFSNAKKVKVRYFTPLNIGSGVFCKPASGNYGIELKPEKNTSTIFVKEASFVIGILDTINIETAKYYIVVLRKNGDLIKNEIEVTNKMIEPITAKHVHYPSLLVTLKFNLVEFSFNKNDRIFFFREDQKEIQKYSTITVVSSKNDYTYVMKDGLIQSLYFEAETENKTIKFNHEVWQARVMFRAYNKQSE